MLCRKLGVSTTAAVGVVVTGGRSFCTTTVLQQKQKQTASGYMANAGKVGGEEKWAQAAMEYIHEKNHVNDSRKRKPDVEQEARLAAAYDRYLAVNDRHFEDRIRRLSERQSEVLAVLQSMGPEKKEGEPCNTLLDECLLMQSEQLPNNLRRPSLSPPVVGYEPGFGLDVPQLRSQQQEYPPLIRPTDRLQYGKDGPRDNSDPDSPLQNFPYVDPMTVDSLTDAELDHLESVHGTIRSTAPVTGVEGEGWESYMALQKKALQRQKLILDLFYDDDGFSERYYSDEDFRAEELERRGLLPLVVEDVSSEPRHYAQEPAYEPFREL